MIFPQLDQLVFTYGARNVNIATRSATLAVQLWLVILKTTISEFISKTKNAERAEPNRGDRMENNDKLGYDEVCIYCCKSHRKKSTQIRCQKKYDVNWIKVESKGEIFVVNRTWFDRMKPLHIDQC